MKECKTPGAIYSIAVHAGGSGVCVMVNLPYPIRANAKEVRRIKNNLHKAVETVLADTFNFYGYSQTIWKGRRTPPAMSLKKERL